jgi:polysaccharide export outer membrane protein
MPCTALKTIIPMVLISIISGACGAVLQNPAGSEVPNRAATNSSSSAPTADINRNIAAAAMFQSSGASSDYKIGPEDLLEITLFNIPEGLGIEQKVTPRTVTVRVTHQGQISLPLLGEIDAKGLTVSSLEKTVRERYDKYIHNPQVGILIREFRQRVSVIGAVQKPGIVELTGPKTVIEILAIAGGVSEKAGSQVHVYRQGVTSRETHVIDLGVLANGAGLINAGTAGMINMPVEPGDMINVPETGMFFVDGAVRKPGSYPLGRRYSLTQALATAGGVDTELSSSNISIFRRMGPGKVDTLAFDLNDIMAGAATDPQLEADDVIVLPVSTTKFIVKRFIGTLVGGISIGSFIGM